MFFFDNIHSLVKKGNINKVAKFLEKKPDTVNLKSKSKGIPINIAIQNNNLQMFEFLLTKGAKIDDYSLTYAIDSKNSELVDFVFKQGANPNSKTMFAYHHSWDTEVKYAITEVFFIFDSKKEKQKHENYCKAVIDLALKYGLKLNKGINIDLMNCATKHSTPEIINYLNQIGLKNEYNSKALQIAISEYNIDLVKTIVKENPKLVNKKVTESETPLEWALTNITITSDIESKKKLIQIAEILVLNNADVNTTNNKGKTVFFQYCWSTFYNTGRLDTEDNLIKLFLSKSTNSKANIFYKELLKGSASKAPIECNNCKTVFILNDLHHCRNLFRSNSLTIKCPHCKKEASNAMYMVEFASDEKWVEMENSDLTK